MSEDNFETSGLTFLSPEAINEMQALLGCESPEEAIIKGEKLLRYFSVICEPILIENKEEA